MQEPAGGNPLVETLTSQFEYLRLVGIAPPAGFAPHELALVGLLAGLVSLALWRLFRDAGFSATEAALVVVAAPLVAHQDVALLDHGPTSLAFNFAGFFIPVALTVKILFEGRAGPGATLFVAAVCTVTAYANSYAVPDQGVMLHYRLPALVAAAAALLVSWRDGAVAARLAFMGGAWGVIVGADAFRIHALLDPESPPSRVVVGGAGILDGIFLVGILATILVISVQTLREALERANREERGRRVRRDGGRARET